MTLIFPLSRPQLLPLSLTFYWQLSNWLGIFIIILQAFFFYSLFLSFPFYICATLCQFLHSAYVIYALILAFLMSFVFLDTLTHTHWHTNTHTYTHRKRKPKWLLSDKLFSNFGWMLICVNGINLHKSINCLFALPLCLCVCVLSHLGLILPLAHSGLKGPPLLANLQIGQKRKNNATRRANWNHIATALTSLPLSLFLHLIIIYEKREEDLRKSEMTSFLLSARLSFPCEGCSLSLSRSLPPGG